MKYQIIQPDTLSTNFLEHAYLPEHYEAAFGYPRQRLKEVLPKENVIFRSDREKQAPYPLFSTINQCMVWAAEMVHIIETYIAQHADLYKFVPVTVLNKSGRPITGNYFILHNLCIKPIIDLNKADYTMYGDGEEKIIGSMDTFVADFNAAAEAPVIEAQYWPDEVFLRNDIVEKIMSKKIKRIRFLDIENPINASFFI